MSCAVPALDLGRRHHLCGACGAGRYRLLRDGELVNERADAVGPLRVTQEAR